MVEGNLPRLQVHAAVATITLRRAARANRLHLEDLAELEAHIAAVNARPEVLVLRLEAEGNTFCAGFNLESMGTQGLDAGARFGEVADALEAARPVTVAVLQGGVYGGATDLCLACDFRIGLQACEMFVPAARLGLHFYASGLQRMVSRLGLGVTKRLMLAGETFSAEAMLGIGFLDQLVLDAAALSAAADTLTERLCGMAPLALLGMKKHLNAIARGSLDLVACEADIASSLRSSDLVEGQAAWREKRVPVFVGR